MAITMEKLKNPEKKANEPIIICLLLKINNICTMNKMKMINKVFHKL